MRASRITSGLLLAFLALVVLAAAGCSSAPTTQGVKPGTAWEPSASGLPTLYVFGDPS